MSDEKTIPIISATAELEAFCRLAAESRYITIDTEFIREKTYYPNLCLVQVACEKQAVIIDPLAAGIDLAPLFGLLQNPDVLKVFHAARQDIEIFYYLTGKIPAPLFDTQVAAMVCGHGESVSYEGLVREITGAQLDKTARFTNWEQRPLTHKQLAYALDDVIHLRTIFDTLEKEIAENGRETWIAEEMGILIDPATYDSHPEDAWKRLKPRSRSPRFLAMLQAAAAWREETAQRLNIPRTRLIKDDTLVDVAASAPKNLNELYALRGMHKGIDAKQMEYLLAALEKAKALPKEQCPELPDYVPLPVSVGAAIELLRVLLKRQCDYKHVAQKLVAGRGDLEKIALGKLEETPQAEGWRWTVFGQYADSLMKGCLAMTLDRSGAVVLLEQAENNPDNSEGKK